MLHSSIPAVSIFSSPPIIKLQAKKPAMCAEFVVSAFEILVTGAVHSLDSGLPLRARLQKYSGFAERPAPQHYRETSLGLTPNKRCGVQTRAANLAYENVIRDQASSERMKKWRHYSRSVQLITTAFCLLLVLGFPRGISLQAQSKCPIHRNISCSGRTKITATFATTPANGIAGTF